MPKKTYFNLSEDKQKRILSCAVDEFAEQGYRAASISRIVAESGIAKGSFYQYFENKADLYGYVIDYAIVQRKMQISKDESIKLEELNLTQFIRVLFGAMIRAFKDQPKLLKIGVDFWRTLSDPVQKHIYEKYRPLQNDYFHIFVHHEKTRGKIDPIVDGDVLGFMLTGISSLIIQHILECGHELLTEEYIDGLVDKIEYILTNGIYQNVK